MKHIFTLAVFLLVVHLTTVGNEKDKAFSYLNNRGEVYFKIYPVNLQKDVALLTRILSVDNIKDKVIYAYANKEEFEKFLTYGLNFDVLTPPSMLHKVIMKDKVDIKNINDWDFYPTYQAYVDMMNQFATDYPDLCELKTIALLPSGHKLLLIHINNDLTTEQNEPEFLYTSTMHGDEVVGYVLMLRLIDNLLSNYGTNTEITNLVNNVDLWINPLANPDGTYAGGDNTVYGATRYNGNGVDLNRNYPDPEDGPHPDGHVYQPETQAFMQLADEHNFVMSVNFHEGAEVVNYPWDTWSKLTADDDWWKFVSHEYADTVHAYSSGYMTGFDNGITNGYAWYSISGGRQDYMNYFQHCRECTIELSDEKTPPASELPDFWNYNNRSLINYIKESGYGLKGIITDSETGNPIEAKVYIEGHDKDNSEVYSSLPVGDYHRMLKAGTYNVTYSKTGYHPQTISVVIQDKTATKKNVQLQPIEGVMADFHSDVQFINPGEAVNFFDDSYGSATSWYWTFPGGEPSTANVKNPQNILYDQVGSYPVTLVVSDDEGHSDTLTKENYIVVSNTYLMENGTVELWSGLFYDTGGDNENYSDNEDLTMTFKPSEPGGKLKVEFLSFDVEENGDCSWDYLEIYDGSAINGTLLGKFCGTGLPGPYTATNNEGALTFVFHSDYNINRAGWKAQLTTEGTGVGIKENSVDNISIYPNPAKDYIFVKAENEILQLFVYDLNGRALLSIPVNNKNARVDIKALNKGLYILKLDTEKGEFFKKVLVN